MNNRQTGTGMVPGRCFLCEVLTPAREALCVACRRDLPRIGNACPVCGRPQSSTLPCPACTRSPPPYDRTVAVYAYAYPVPDLVREMKYRRNLVIARDAGERLAEQVRGNGAPYPQCLLPVPLHPLRLAGRGYNQSLEIARSIADRLGLPLDHRLIRRNRPTLAQFDLSPRQRARNIRGAFSIASPREYRRVVIVDDVMTSGATVREMARLLKDSGVAAVDVWTYARAV